MNWRRVGGSRSPRLMTWAKLGWASLFAGCLLAVMAAFGGVAPVLIWIEATAFVLVALACFAAHLKTDRPAPKLVTRKGSSQKGNWKVILPLATATIAFLGSVAGFAVKAWPGADSASGATAKNQSSERSVTICKPDIHIEFCGRRGCRGTSSSR